MNIIMDGNQIKDLIINIIIFLWDLFIKKNKFNLKKNFLIF